MTPLGDEALRAALRAEYGITVAEMDVELAGADVGAWAWRVTGDDGRRRFLKLRRDVRPAAILVPRHLAANGFPEIVSALPTVDGAAWFEIDGWTGVLMDLVEGIPAIGTNLSLDGWRRLGAFSARLHAVELPDELRAAVPAEGWSAAWVDRARSLDARIGDGRGWRRDGASREREPRGSAAPDEHARAVRDRWIAERAVIRRIVDLSEALGGRIRARPRPPRFVLCHGDFHGWNLIVDPDGAFHVIDWDEVQLAPPERDLVFVRGSVVAGPVSAAAADAFEAGYGAPTVDREVLAWYRIDWALQDVVGYALEVLDEPDREPSTRPRAHRIFEGLFDPGGEVAGALAIADQLGA